MRASDPGPYPAPDPHAVDNATLLRYLDGTATPAEVAHVRRWASADAANARTLDALRAAWHPAPPADLDAADAMWTWVAARMHAPADDAGVLTRPIAPPPPSIPASRWAVRPRLLGLAATLLIAALTGATVARWRLGSPARDAVPTTAGAAAQREYTAPRGQQVAVDLADGSRVVLGPGSRLRVSGASREVRLEGKAFFTVRHDAAHPFVVHTAHGVAEDLGTEFVVTSYAETGATQVVVASGAVALRDVAAGAAADRPRLHLTLGPGDLGRVDATGAVTAQRGVNVGAHLAWTRGELAFDAVPVADALPELARRYDVELRLPPGVDGQRLGARRLTATFRDEPVARVLRLLELALDVRAVREANGVTLVPVDPETRSAP